MNTNPSLRMLLVVGAILVLATQVSACQVSDTSSSDLSQARSVDIAVTQEGIYQIPVSSLGWDDVNLSGLQLTNRDQELPAWVSGKGQDAKIYFYGLPSQSVYTNENIYQLKISSPPGLRISDSVQANNLKTPAIDQVSSTIRKEENSIYTPIVEVGDHWFWAKLLAPTTQSAEITLEDLISGEAEIRVELWGNTLAEIEPDHHAIIRINGQQVGEGTWDGQTRTTIEAIIPKGILKNGSNTVEVEIPGDTGPHVDIVYLDWIEISYPRLARFEGDQLSFTTPQATIELSNFRDEAYLFDVTNPISVSVRTISEESPTFQGENDHQYIAVSAGSWLQPAFIETTTLTPDLRDLDSAADYIAIGPEDLLEPLAPLMEWREAQDLRVMAIPVTAIYDQFNGGISEPEAIRSFLAFAVENWVSAPKYVLLVGDASYDFRGYTDSKNTNRLPVMMIQTSFGGETVSDVMLADIDDDQIPDLAIGRIPAQTPEQVEIYVKKVLHYESIGPDVDWQRRILAVADGQESNFKTSAKNFLDLFPSDFNTTLLAPAAGDETANQEVVKEIESGYWLIAYFGHGSVNMWGKDRLFTIEDSANLSSPDHLPIMLHMTCLTGLFTHPTQESLTESLLWQPGGGAIAIISPTSLTLPGAQEFLSTAFVQALLQSPDRRLGDVVLDAWRQVPIDLENSVEVMQTFLLFGDPALKLPSFTP